MIKIVRYTTLALGLAFVLTPAALRAHCDTLEGPVVSAARDALKSRDVTPVLKWVQPDDENAIRDAFARTLVVRPQSPAAAELADTWFFETLVRIHRAGEGAPFTGLKSEATAEPGIVAADHALVSGKLDDVAADTTAPLQTALKTKFERVRSLQAHADHNVAAGREYVAAYVDYVHFAERLAALAIPSAGHGAEHAH